LNRCVVHRAYVANQRWSLDQTIIQPIIESRRESMIAHTRPVALELLNEPAVPVNTVPEAGRSTIS